MNRYFIEEVKCDWKGGCGLCCGAGVVTTSVKYRNEDGSLNWLTLSEIDGMLYFFVSDEGYFDKFVAVDDLSEGYELYDEVMHIHEDLCLTEFAGVNLENFESSDYYLEVLEEMEETYDTMLMKYAIRVDACETDEVEKLMKAGTGKYIDEVKNELFSCN